MPGIVLTILTALPQIVKTGADIVARVQAGDLTEAEAEREWQKTRDIFTRGKAAWDAAADK